MSNENSQDRRRRRIRSHTKSNNKAKEVKKKSSSKDYTKLTGIGLVIFGIAMCMYSFGIFDGSSDFMHLPDFSDAIQLWPVFIVISGFGFLIKDYVQRYNKQKWDS
ncbi:hypothetical protein HQ865_17565 [Mucilaginibacter mali]|uniref:Uncharacterized protein n=1 Tax=Mucilaginibacter mali TaxID=2740462 RepID=A0A7D4UC48_9SPHI|nr:hypothetical protein [Mucilaginibacter mali]QKJ31498.1 hypothetical protein HQ865_17565 [Mucilaginibacter mali]